MTSRGHRSAPMGAPRTGSPSHEADRYISEILEDDATRSAKSGQVRPRRHPWSGALLLISIPLLALSTAFNVMQVSAAPPAFTPEQDEAALRFAVYLVARQIEAHWEGTGRLPGSIHEIDPDEDRIKYAAEGITYVLSAHTPRGVVLYRRGEDLAPLASAARGLVGGLK
jgi:hypothetical protein